MRALITSLTAIAAVALANGASAIDLKLNGIQPPEHPGSMTHRFFAERSGS